MGNNLKSNLLIKNSLTYYPARIYTPNFKSPSESKQGHSHTHDGRAREGSKATMALRAPSRPRRTWRPGTLHTTLGMWCDSLFHGFLLPGMLLTEPGGAFAAPQAPPGIRAPGLRPRPDPGPTSPSWASRVERASLPLAGQTPPPAKLLRRPGLRLGDLPVVSRLRGSTAGVHRAHCLRCWAGFLNIEIIQITLSVELYKSLVAVPLL